MVAAVNMEAAVDLLSAWLTEERFGRYVCLTGVHGVMEGLRDSAIQRVHNRAAACLPDGMPMTWLGRSMGHPAMNRVYGPDLMLRMMEMSAFRGYTNYFLGGVEGVAGELGARMERRYPGLRVVGSYCPPFRQLSPEEERKLIRNVEQVTPDLLWVGLSTPKQELFMARYRDRLNAKVLVGVGAAFDFHTGRKRQAPRWVMRAGFEWAFRMLTEPRRLATRYLRNVPAFLLHALLQQTGLRNYIPSA